MKSFKEFLTESIDKQDIKWYESQIKAFTKAYLDAEEQMEELLRDIVVSSDYDLEVEKNKVYKAIDSYSASFGKVQKAFDNLMKRAQGK